MEEIKKRTDPAQKPVCLVLEHTDFTQKRIDTAQKRSDVGALCQMDLSNPMDNPSTPLDLPMAPLERLQSRARWPMARSEGPSSPIRRPPSRSSGQEFFRRGHAGAYCGGRAGIGGAIAGWIFVMLLRLGGVAVFVLADLGHFYNVTQEPGFIAGYFVSFFLAIYGLLATIRKLKIKSAYPYTPGRYLLPLDFIDARDEKLKITPMRELEDFRGVHHHTHERPPARARVDLSAGYFES